MSSKYTIEVETDGQPVWRRWTGDREEAARIFATALVDLEVEERRAEMAMATFTDIGPDIMRQTIVLSADYRSTVRLHILPDKDASTEDPVKV
jgi:hypothetical protein